MLGFGRIFFQLLPQPTDMDVHRPNIAAIFIGPDGVGVLICGKRARILGRVCMDQLMVDVTDIMEADVDTPVTLIGKDGDEEITMEHLAELCGGFHYEMVCDIGKRVPRVYYRGGKIVGTMDCFTE